MPLTIGPLTIASTAATCAGVRQPSFWPDLHWIVFASNLHTRGSPRMPSFSPSSVSHFSSTAFATVWRAAASTTGVSSFFGSGYIFAVTVENDATMPWKLIAGAPAMMPSKSSG